MTTFALVDKPKSYLMFKGFLISQECIIAGDGGKLLKYMIFLLTCEGLSGENTILSENEL